MKKVREIRSEENIPSTETIISTKVDDMYNIKYIETNDYVYVIKGKKSLYNVIDDGAYLPYVKDHNQLDIPYDGEALSIKSRQLLTTIARDPNKCFEYKPCEYTWFQILKMIGSDWYDNALSIYNYINLLPEQNHVYYFAYFDNVSHAAYLVSDCILYITPIDSGNFNKDFFDSGLCYYLNTVYAYKITEYLKYCGVYPGSYELYVTLPSKSAWLNYPGLSFNTNHPPRCNARDIIYGKTPIPTRDDYINMIRSGENEVRMKYWLLDSMQFKYLNDKEATRFAMCDTKVVYNDDGTIKECHASLNKVNPQNKKSGSRYSENIGVRPMIKIVSKL